jgi:hypothetical protein
MASSKMDLWYSGALQFAPHPTAIKRYLLKKLGPCCSECGWSEVNPWSGKIALALDHIDGDHANSSPSNFRLLCPNCHALTPTFGGLNRKTVRQGFGPCRPVADPLNIPDYD